MIKEYSDLSLDEKIGQLFVIGFNEDYYSEKLDELINKYKFGNIILFGRNIKNMESLFSLNKKIQQKMLNTLKTPAFIAIDQEGGMVTRLFKGATVFPGAMTISATGDLNNAYQAGKFMATEMDALGINVNFAPVLDVNTNPLNPGIGVRSYSDNPQVVGDFGKKYIKGLQQKVFATAKHFPGKGDAAVDSHLALPVVKHDLKRLSEIEIYPFKEAVNAGVKGVMTSHAVYDYLNKDFPATLAKEALTNLLRNDLGFKGLIFTDGMEMQAIDDLYGAAKSAVTAILAGVDLVLYCHYENQQIEAFNYVKAAILNNKIPIELIDEKVKRILAFKQQINLEILNNEFSDVSHLVNQEKHRKFALDVVDNALTLVKGEVFNLKAKTLFILQKPQVLTLVEEKSDDNNVLNVLKENFNEFTIYESSLNPTEEEISNFVRISKDFAEVIITTYNSNMYKGQVELIKAFTNLNEKLHVIALRNPYDLHLVPEIKNYVCLYEYTSNSLRTLIKYLNGDLIPQGMYPVKL